MRFYHPPPLLVFLLAIWLLIAAVSGVVQWILTGSVLP